MGKTYKQKTCAYCGVEGASQTNDHVFARAFFPSDRRDGLPQVPSCEQCNREKARLEHYLATVLPFASRHPVSSKMLAEKVGPRLNNNRKLHLALAKGKTRTWTREGGLIVPTIALPFDGVAFGALFRLVTRGLVLHHFGAVVPPTHWVGAGMMRGPGEVFFGRMMALRASERVFGDLGEGLVQYEGLRGTDDPFLTIWKLRMYGGFELRGDDDEPHSTIWAQTSRFPQRDIFSDADPPRTPPSGLKDAPAPEFVSQPGADR